MSNPSRAVLITGCSSGIGAATASRLARAGWTVYATARRPETLAALEADGCRTLALDVVDEASRQAAVDAVVDAEGAVGVLINNAGYSQSGAVESIPDDRVRAQFETNVFGPLALCRLVLPGMRDQGWGKIVQLSSMGGKLTFPGGGLYHATKHAVEAISDALRFEVKSFGVDVIVIEPGLITSGFGDAAVRGLGAASAPDGPYEEFNRAVGEASRDVYEKGLLSKLGGPPEAVAERIEDALNAKRPRARYTVTPSARALLHPPRGPARPRLGLRGRRVVPATGTEVRSPRKQGDSLSVGFPGSCVRPTPSPPFSPPSSRSGRRRRPPTASSAATCSRVSATPSVIARFAPDGTAKGVLADSAGAGPLCFDPSGEHLVAPGTGLYDSTGTRLASAWASVTPVGDCTVDRAGNVYLAGGPVHRRPLTGRATIRKFDLTGHPLGSYDVAATGYTYGRAVYSLDLAADQCTIYYGLDGGEDIQRYDVCTQHAAAAVRRRGLPCDQLRVRPNGQVAVTCDTYGELLDASGTRAMNFANPSDPPSTSGRFAALDADGTSFWMGTLAGLLARYDIASGQRLDRWTAGLGLGGIAVYNPSAPPAQGPGNGGGSNTTQSTSGSSTFDATLGAQTFAMASSVPSLDMPALAVAHGRLLTSGRSLRLDTGLQVSCPAAGPKCTANVTLTVAGAVRARRAASVTRVGTLSTKIAPGAKAKLVVRLNKKGAALIRKRSAVTIAARVSIRAGTRPAVVRKTSVRVLMRHPR